MSKKRKLTDAQKYCDEFETLSEIIIKKIFSGTDAEINKTVPSKDGGYDIVVECRDGGVHKKVYFECKLRSENLNLRDISANLIIAFNEGAVALVVLTNHDYTEQTGKQLNSFLEKTVLNIKLILGEDVQNLVQLHNIEVSDGLSKIIFPKLVNRKPDYQVLRINLSYDELHRQFLEKEFYSNSISDTYLSQIYPEKICAVKECLIKGDTVCIKGGFGVGKTSFIQTVLSVVPQRLIHVIASNYTSQTQMLLAIFLDIWGIPLHSIVRDFSDDMVDKIVEIIEEKNEKNTGNIVKHLLGKTTPEGITNEHYNLLVCQYLIEQILMHKENLLYVFYIEHASLANEEVQILLYHICTMLMSRKIACIIECESTEFVKSSTEKKDFFSSVFVNKVKKSFTVDYMSEAQADSFVKKELWGYPEQIQKALIKKGGVRLVTLATLIAFAKTKRKESEHYNYILNELQKFTQNDVLQPINVLLDFYYENTPDLFHYFYFFNGYLPLEWSDKLIEASALDGEIKIIDKLLNLKFLKLDDSGLIVANEIVMDIIKNYHEEHLFKSREIAKRLISFLEDTDTNLYLEPKVIAYFFLGNYNLAIPLLNTLMMRLQNERQYSTFLKYINLVLENSNRMNLSDEYLCYIIVSGLKIWVVKREINCKEAEYLLITLKKVLESGALSSDENYLLYYQYFLAEKHFKNCDFTNSLALTKSYYIECLQGKTIKTDYEWYEKICIIYALSIKEKYGNEEAQKIFQSLITIFPDSFSVQLEYLDHQECLSFYKNPNYALNCVEQVLEMFENSTRLDFPLPYHEYVDRAMCAFCAKKYDDALLFAENAIEILNSNGIMTSLGRAYNIKGCILVCKEDYNGAEACFTQANYLTVEFKDYLYSWRSKLNFVYLKLVYKRCESDEEVKEMLDETYGQFKKIYQEKILEMGKLSTFNISREYFALLMFGHAYKIIKINIEQDILDAFFYDNWHNIFHNDLKQLYDGRSKKPSFFNCAYAKGKYLFMIG